MSTLELSLLVPHVLGGGVALLSGPVAILAKKGGGLHRKAGAVFAVSMGITAVVAFPLSLLTRNALLLTISVRTLFFIHTGVSAIWRRRHPRVSHAYDFLVPGLAGPGVGVQHLADP